LKTSFFTGQAAGDRRALLLSAGKGTYLTVGESGPFTPRGSVFTVAAPSASRWVISARRQTPLQKHKNMTCLAADGGEASGSHPAWDPV
jgi:hypothetical protein